jgi:hypothetical protein
LALAATFIAVVTAGFLVFGRRVPAFEATQGEQRLAKGMVVRSSTTPIRFGDGSLLHLNAEAEVLLREVHQGRVELDITRGALEAEIVPHQGIHWTFNCGAWTVGVLGTAFRVRHDGDIFELTVHRGSVRVTGPSRSMTVSAGQSVSAIGDKLLIPAPFEDTDSTPELSATDPSSKRPTRGKESPHRKASSTSKANAASPAPSALPAGAPSQTTVPSIPSWVLLAERGDFRAALTELQRVGPAAILRSASSRETLLLADVARLGGDESLARTALSKARSDFGPAVAAEAAFRLGRLEADLGHHLAALEAFGAVLQGSPSRTTDEAARGRRLELLRHLGRTNEVAAEAAEYLARYPQGTHRHLAESLLEK